MNNLQILQSQRNKNCL